MYVLYVVALRRRWQGEEAIRVVVKGELSVPAWYELVAGCWQEYSEAEQRVPQVEERKKVGIAEASERQLRSGRPPEVTCKRRKQ